jgi:catechol 2,3-dioxygenase-like lactoylglutathione lyase family enzyme
MLKDAKIFSSFSVNDLEKARQFYGKTLDLKTSTPMNQLQLDFADCRVFIYGKPNHEPASFTVLNFPVENVEEVVDELTEKGVVFEKYDSEYLKTDEKGIMHGGGEKGPTIAWFKDPAGNILSIVEAGNQ